MPLSAFIIRPFGTKEVPGAPEDTVTASGEKIRTCKLESIDFDKVHEGLIKPALEQLHIAANTTEVIVSSGNIREDMFHLLMTADLVVADVTMHNPNVFYELGIRHAFRDKYTFLIRSDVSDYPFDLKTDRYFQYKHRQITDKTVKDLAMAIRATLTSERADSPVFRLLPRMRTEDRSRFISVPRDFREEVERARKYRRGGDLRLLAAECEGFLWEVEGLREVGRAQFELNFIGGARATWEQISQRYPDDVEANMILSTIYQRVNDGTRSEQALARISRLPVPDVNTAAEIQSLIGRNFKARWMEYWHHANGDEGLAERQRRALRSPLLRKACEAYHESFRENLNYAYSGLNALSLMITEISLAEADREGWKLVVDRQEEAEGALEQRKRDVRELTAALQFAIRSQRERLDASGQVDFWFETMEAAFACLTSNCSGRVEQAYREAIVWAPRYAESAMRRALEVYRALSVRHFDPTVDIQGNVNMALDVIRREQQKREQGGIVLFVGLRMEPMGWKPPAAAEKKPMKFLPPEAEEWAREEIGKVLDREIECNGKVLFGMAAGSNGADLLFHEVCEERNVKTRIYLALPKDRYIGEYVSDAGAEWVDRFNRVYRRLRKEESAAGNIESDSDQVVSVLADSGELPRWLQSKTGYTIGRRNTIWMLQHALMQRHVRDDQDTDLTLIALWDRKKVESNGGIGGLVQMAEQQGIKVIHIDCSKWASKSEPSPDRSAIQKLSSAVQGEELVVSGGEQAPAAAIP